MILVGNQRGGAKNLALHLLKEENDHVTVHELRGFASDNLMGALNESYAISRATQCQKFLYSLSINPPPQEQVATQDFEAAIDRAEMQLGLSGQPRAIVFHEKEGRRHAHAVWSRINADEMKAIPISHDKLKLTDLSRDLYREHGFKMPTGLMRSAERDPRNFTLEEWQQAKRSKMKPPEVNAAMSECWAVSDSRASFEHALQSRGFKLARGDSRGFVAVDMHGEVYSVPKKAGVRTKQVRDRLGELERDYASVEDRKKQFAEEIGKRLHELRLEEEHKAQEERERRETERRELVERQRAERQQQTAALQARWNAETEARQERFNQGWRKLLDHFTGRQQRIRERNMAESYEAILRDRKEKDALIFRQVEERRMMQSRAQDMQREQEARKAELDADIRRQAEFARVADPAPIPNPTVNRPTSRGPPEPQRPVPPVPTPEATKERLRETFMRQRENSHAHDTQQVSRSETGAHVAQPARQSSLNLQREEFVRQRQEEAAKSVRSRGTDLDFSR